MVHHGGNPVACRPGAATLELIEGGLLDSARDVGELLVKGRA